MWQCQKWGILESKDGEMKRIAMILAVTVFYGAAAIYP
jgi:hypothetical protein